MAMKKDRKKGRLLKKELKVLRTEINAYKNILRIRLDDFHRERKKLHELQTRVVTIKCEYFISVLESRSLEWNGVTPYDIVKDSLISEIAYSENLRNMINVKQDPSYVGQGTRYVASLECLTPLYDIIEK